jgi:hypothetical protein
MKNLFKKLLQSLYCVNIPCALCSTPMSIKVWYSFRGADTYFCQECVNAVCKKLTYNKSVDLKRMDSICKEVEIERRINEDKKHNLK